MSTTSNVSKNILARPNMKCYLFKASLYINSYLTSEQCLHQFCLTNLFLRAKLNKTVANFAHILEIDWPLSTLRLMLEK